MTDECGEVVWANYEWAWGGRYTHHYTSQSLNDCAILEHDLQPIRFQGQFYDVETGLHYNRFRYYDSDVGMFIQRDPIGLLGGWNVFAYAPNPVGWVDPWGLAKSHESGERGNQQAGKDILQQGLTAIVEELTIAIKVGAKDVRIRIDRVAADSAGILHGFEVKNGSGHLTDNQKDSGVFDMSNPSNSNSKNTPIDLSKGKTATACIATSNKDKLKRLSKHIPNIKRDDKITIVFHLLKYNV